MRPGYVIGPYDHTGRFPWWAHRAARGGEMIVPASLARAFQAIDTRDLAEFLLLRARSPLTGIFNATGPVPPITMLDLVEAAASASDTDLNVEVVDDAFLARAGDRERAAALGGRRPGLGRVGEHRRAQGDRGGADVPPVDDTVAATLAETAVVPGIGLEPEREAELLAAWHGR